MTELSPKQQAILCAAINHFGQYGLAATTMEGISATAQVSKRTLYKHYSTKDELFGAVVDKLIERIQPLTTIQFIPNYDFKVQLQHLARSAVELLNDEDYLTLSRIVMIESLRSKSQAERLAERFVNCECALVQWFDDAAKTGCLGPFPAEIAAAFFWGGLKKLTYWEQVLKWRPALDEQALDELLDQTCRLFCLGVTPRL